ncbi:MAG: hypothetical protein RLZZ501_353 [Pseudomonadota bacterium]|jgi:hypothetical protein
MTPADLALLARLSEAAYSIYPAETRQRVAALGLDFVGQVATDLCSVTVVRWNGRQVVAVQGTRVAENTSLGQLFCDIDTDSIATQRGVAMDGFWSPLAALWPSVALLLDPGRPLLATGHSLGGIRAELVPALAPACDAVVSFGAPQGAEAGFWRRLYRPDGPALTRVVFEADFAPGWPWLDGVSVEYDHPPGPFLWLHDGRAEMVSRRPALNLSVADHAIDAAYIPALAALAKG